MERLTFEGNFCDIALCTNTRGGSFCEDGYCSQRKVWERLKYFEDLQEQGRLVELPCKVGDRLYRVDIDPLITEREVQIYDVGNIVICTNGDILFKYDTYDGCICDLKCLINKTPYLDYYSVYLTEAEAQAALERMEGKK